MNHLTKLLAKSQGPVRVNCVAPGLIETRITHGGESWQNPPCTSLCGTGTGGTVWHVTEEWDGPHAAVKAHSPLKRVGQPVTKLRLAAECY